MTLAGHFLRTVDRLIDFRLFVRPLTLRSTAIGASNGEPCIKVYVLEKTDELTEKIPSRVDGFPVVIQQTGEVRALEE